MPPRGYGQLAVLVLVAWLPGCGPGSPSSEAVEGSDTFEGANIEACEFDGDSERLVPFRAPWQIEAQVPFPHLRPDGAPQITRLEIGGLQSGDNFINRGDVIVRFADTDEITIEMRRFTMASSVQSAISDFSKLHLWAYDAAKPVPPSQLDAADRCDRDVWQEDCKIFIYYEGQQQLLRLGADLRVTLPETYRHTIEVTTSDNDVDADYHDRGHVCIEGLNGSAHVELESGEAFVIMAENATATPRCSADQIAACDAWVDPESGTPKPWDSACPCLAQVAEFGSLQMATDGPSAANMVVDVPPHLWASILLENQGTGQEANPAQDTPGTQCDADVTVPGYLLDPISGTEDTRVPWFNKGYLNQVSTSILGGGFNIGLSSSSCAPVAAAAEPCDSFHGDGGEAEIVEERGNLEVCSGCLRGKSCEELLPGT